MLSARYELKFVVDGITKQCLLDQSRHGLIADANGVNATYRVTSQYFDTADLNAYYEKLDGEEIRKKVRLRFYSVSQDEKPRVSTAFMEIKHRINNRVFKERVRLTDEGAEAILTDSHELRRLQDHVVSMDRGKRSTINTLMHLASKVDFRSVNVISYLREAWVGQDDGRLRLTFDSCCEAYAAQDYHFAGIGVGQSILAANRQLMEVKFDRAIPRWIRDLLVVHGIQMQRFSKYAAGVEACCLVAAPRRR